MGTRTTALTVVLALILVIAPAVALASCSHGMAGMSGTEMGGMIMPPPGLAFSEMPNVSCCVIAPAEITSSWLAQLDATASAVDLRSVGPQDVPQYEEPVLISSFLAETPPTQATLCVFLI